MKKLVLFFGLCPTLLFAQTNRVSTMAGDFLNPLVWNPMGIPASGDSLTINHAIVMNTDAYYTAGQIKINSGGSLIQDGTPRTVWADGGSIVNYGTYSTHAVLVSGGGYITNAGSFTGIDSLVVGADFQNSGTAGVNDFWVMYGGTVNNSGTLTNTDSMFVQGDFINSGTAGVYDLAFDQLATLDNSGMLNVTNNMHNEGHLYNSYVIEVANDFSNCNIQSLYAVFDNDGIVCFGNDFLNCDPDSLTGSGDYFVGNLSTNMGVFAENFTFHTPNGSLSLNTGTVQGTVTITTGACSAGLNDLEATTSFYPNPAEDVIHVSDMQGAYEIHDLYGKCVAKGTTDDGTIRVESLPTGTYFLQVNGSAPARLLKF